MGYRKLLKAYMSHVKQVTGCDFVQLAVLTEALSGREIGELRSIAAEIRRESHAVPDVDNHNNIAAQLLANDELSLDQLAGLSGMELLAEQRPWSADQVRNALRNLSHSRPSSLKFSRSAESDSQASSS